MTSNILCLEGKVAVVTGGTSGIGRAISLGLANAGADVVPTGRRQPEIDVTAADIEARGRKTLRQSADVGNRATLEALLVSVLDHFGKVDLSLIHISEPTRQA